MFTEGKEVSVSVDVGKEAANAVEFNNVVDDPQTAMRSRTEDISVLRLMAEAHIKKQIRPSTSAISSG